MFVYVLWFIVLCFYKIFVDVNADICLFLLFVLSWLFVLYYSCLFYFLSFIYYYLFLSILIFLNEKNRKGKDLSRNGEGEIWAKLGMGILSHNIFYLNQIYLHVK